MTIDRCFNIADFRKAAKRRLPSPLFNFIDGGADDEVTLRGSTSIFDDCQLVPTALSDVSTIDLTTTVFGKKIDWPVIMAPTGTNRLFHHEGERAVAKVAAEMGTIYSLSTMGTVSIEEIGALTTGPKCFQVYIHRDRGMTREFVGRAKAAKYDALCLTIDTLVAGNRERDKHTGMVVPPKLTLASMISFASHWRWAYDYATHDPFKLANITGYEPLTDGKLHTIIDYVNAQFDPSITWADAEELIKQWDGPFAFKGILTAEDARRAVDIGATAIMVSTHGGRQLDGVPSPFEVLGEIADAVGDKADIILDGGVRRGSHVIKALAMGADACSIGRGYLYPLAAGGEPAVRRAMSLLRQEIERSMVLLGETDVSKLDRSRLRRAGIGRLHEGVAAPGLGGTEPTAPRQVA
jgi:L-lactate dehydrogenase (cytochrome)